MKVDFTDLDDIRRLIRRRRLMGGDRYDEVWDGVYVMSPLADNEHQELATRISSAFLASVGAREGARILAGTNVSDRPENWRKNYRCPDVAVFLPGNRAEDRGSHWLGGPDFAVEIVSRRDRSRKKLGFYAGVGVRELLIVDRYPWRLELYRLADGEYDPAVVSRPEDAAAVVSRLLGLTFRLVPAHSRPRIEIANPADGRTWLA